MDDVALARARLAHPHPQQLQRGEHRGERIAQLVSQHGQEFVLGAVRALGLFLGSAQVSFVGLGRRHVLGRSDQSDPIAAVDEELRGGADPAAGGGVRVRAGDAVPDVVLSAVLAPDGAAEGVVDLLPVVRMEQTQERRIVERGAAHEAEEPVTAIVEVDGSGVEVHHPDADAGRGQRDLEALPGLLERALRLRGLALGRGFGLPRVANPLAELHEKQRRQDRHRGQRRHRDHLLRRGRDDVAEGRKARQGRDGERRQNAPDDQPAERASVHVRKDGGDRKNRRNGERRGRERKQVRLHDRVRDARARDDLRSHQQMTLPADGERDQGEDQDGREDRGTDQQDRDVEPGPEARQQSGESGCCDGAAGRESPEPNLLQRREVFVAHRAFCGHRRSRWCAP